MTVTPDGVDTALLRLSRVQLVQYVPGAADEWHKALASLPWLNDDGLAWCVDHFIREGVPAGRFWLRPSDIRDLAKTKRQRVPAHLQCEHHHDEYEWNCTQCPKRIESADPAVREGVRQLAARLRLEARAREDERATALQAQADAAARRRAEQLEKKRQIQALKEKTP